MIYSIPEISNTNSMKSQDDNVKNLGLFRFISRVSYRRSTEKTGN